MLSILISPSDVFDRKPMSAPELNDIDRRIVAEVRRLGCPNVWTLLNVLASEEGRGDRHFERHRRLELLFRVHRLKWHKVIFGCGRNQISAVPPPPRKRTQRNPRQRSVTERARLTPVSGVKTGTRSDLVNSTAFPQPTPAQAIPLMPFPEKPKASGNASKISSDEISRAAATLGKTPRTRWVWTGWVKGVRFRRRQRIIIPGKGIHPAYIVRRGKIYVIFPEDGTANCAYRFDADEVEIYRSPEAQLLARQKTGVQEKRSECKRRSCQKNGRAPVRPGNRPRGRPRTRSTIPQS